MPKQGKYTTLSELTMTDVISGLNSNGSIQNYDMTALTDFMDKYAPGGSLSSSNISASKVKISFTPGSISASSGDSVNTVLEAIDDAIGEIKSELNM